ncbi:MAG: transcriptional repressor [Vallitalea sp.]|nr:transcriptional repressor [Vallitalea sp.]
MNINKIIIDISEKNHIRLTHQRKKVIEILISNSNRHVSAEDIYTLIKDKDDNIGLATIYRTIKILEDKGILIRHDFGNGEAKYEFVMKEKEKHDHLICKQCGKIIEMAGILPENLNQKVLKEKGFYCKEFHLIIYGYCDECNNVRVNQSVHSKVKY